MVEPESQVKAVKDDPNDDHVVSCAIAAGAEAIITGDNDLLRMGSYQGIRMVTVRDFLERGQGKA
jgi:predicted nucleic acid-binding protein